MLKLRSITKDYKSGDTVVHALKGVDISFRKSEFVSILGPSGCGKTTLLNIIGGLDHYTDGELYIDNISTKNYNDRDWDTYRNHRIGFIFQSYNLIPHQTISENVELALTISGIGKAERIKRAHDALDRVGLAGLYGKKPNQLSGGQCQRVAIARALVNEPEILLADEPTGALDTVTSVQIMDLIQEIAKECLVIMVTHNPELAEKYSTRIIRLLDGEVQSDSDPFDDTGLTKESPETLDNAESAQPADERAQVENDTGERPTESDTPKTEKAKDTSKKAKLSFASAFKLSARNLWSKIKRTLLVCFAGSIGIIGVATVLAVSSGVQNYIRSMQDDMLSGNPVTISESALDLSSFMNMADMGMQFGAVKDAVEDGKVNVDKVLKFLVERSSGMENFMVSNDITEEYVKFVKAMPIEYYAAIVTDYGINLSNNLYTDYTFEDENGEPVIKNMSISAATQTYMSMLDKLEDYRQYATYLPLVSSSFEQAPDNDGFILSQYDILSGTLPDGSQSRIAKNADEVMIVVNSDTELADLMLAQYGYYPQNIFFNNVYEAVEENDRKNGKPVENPRFDPELKKDSFDYDELLGKTFTWYPNDTVFEANKSLAPTEAFVPFKYKPVSDPAWQGGKQLKVTAILRPKKDIMYGSLRSGFYYTAALAEEIIDINKDSAVVKKLADNSYDHDHDDDPNTPPKKVNMYEANGYPYNDRYPGMTSTVNIPGTDTYLTIKAGITYKYDYYFEGSTYSEEAYLGTKSSMGAMMDSMMPNTDSAGMFDACPLTLRELGGAIKTNAAGEYKTSRLIPYSIRVYPIDFDIKDNVTDYLSQWNSDDDLTFTYNGETITVPKYKTDENGDKEVYRSKVTYTDNLAIVITMINTMINIVTSALIAFTALSLVVSTVMIAIITYVSVIERIKEIGVIRSLGGRKRDVSALFNAETFIIGGISGVLGIAVTYAISGIINLVIGTLFGIYTIAMLPWYYALLMIAISIILTLISGLIPASLAAKKDPVEALRSE